jgi:hypothetical protein
VGYIGFTQWQPIDPRRAGGEIQTVARSFLYRVRVKITEAAQYALLRRDTAESMQLCANREENPLVETPGRCRWHHEMPVTACGALAAYHTGGKRNASDGACARLNSSDRRLWPRPASIVPDASPGCPVKPSREHPVPPSFHRRVWGVRLHPSRGRREWRSFVDR